LLIETLTIIINAAAANCWLYKRCTATMSLCFRLSFIHVSLQATHVVVEIEDTRSMATRGVAAKSQSRCLVIFVVLLSVFQLSTEEGKLCNVA